MILSTMDIDHPVNSRCSATTCWTRNMSSISNHVIQFENGHSISRYGAVKCFMCQDCPKKYKHKKYGIFSTFSSLLNHWYGHRGDTSMCCKIDDYKFSTISCRGCVSTTNGCVIYPSYPSLHVGRVPSYRQLQLCVFYLVLVILLNPAEGCSSRSTPKPRPPSPTMRPNITFQTYACPAAYAAWYCLNGATCFTVKIGISILYNCECADGFMGQRCEFKDLDGSYLSSQKALRMSMGSSSGSLVVVGALLLITGVAILAIVFTIRRTRAKLPQNLRYIESESGHDTVGSDTNVNPTQDRQYTKWIYGNQRHISSVDIMERTISFKLDRKVNSRLSSNTSEIY